MGRVAPTDELNSLRTHGPGFPLLFVLPQISTQSILGEKGLQEAPVVTHGDTPANSAELRHVVTARVMAILSQLAIVIGVVLVSMRHFDNVKTGIAVAVLYLLLPYTAMWTGSVTHALPGALLVWAIVFYRWPLVAGAIIGLAFGTIYYPMFLLPLWISFYWQRGMPRFLIGLVVAIGGRDIGRLANVERHAHVRSAPAADVRRRIAGSGQLLGRMGQVLATHLSLPDHRRASRPESQHGNLASPEESRHAHQPTPPCSCSAPNSGTPTAAASRSPGTCRCCC